jgi:hypothetical protein
MPPPPSRFKVATAELLLIFPAALFMTALFVRNLQPLQYQPAHAAQQIVDWYAARPGIGLWGLLIALPLVVLVTGLGTIFHLWTTDTELRQATRQAFKILTRHSATALISAATLAAGGFLAIVALHMLTD